MTLRERARYLRTEARLRVRTDWPVWAVVAVSALAGWHVGKQRGVGWGIAHGLIGLVVMSLALLSAEDSGRREERDRRRR